MKVVFLAPRFPDDPGHLAVLSQMVDLTVYGSSYYYSPPLQATTAGSNAGRYSVKPPAGSKTRVFSPRLRNLGPLFWIFPGLAAALNEDRPDVIHVISEPWGLLPVRAAAWSRRNRSNAFVIHGCDSIWWHGGRLEQLARRNAARWALARADGYAGESSRAVDRACSSGLSRIAPTAVVHTNPRDPGLFRPAKDESEKRDARRQLGLPLEGIGVGFMARFLARKGPLLFLDALSSLRIDGAWAAIAGAGPLQQEVEAQASAQGVTYLGGLAFPDHVLAFYRAVDVFVVPSWTTNDSEEQGPRALIEAMLSSCVVVGSACGSIPEMIGDAGIVVRERDPDDLARGIAEAAVLATDRSVGARARQKALARYSPQRVAEQLVRLWDDALDVRGRRNSSRRRTRL